VKSIIQLKFNVEVLKSLPASKFTVTFKQALLFDNLLKFFFLLPEVPKVLLLLSSSPSSTKATALLEYLCPQLQCSRLIPQLPRHVTKVLLFLLNKSHSFVIFVLNFSVLGLFLSFLDTRTRYSPWRL